MGLNDILGLWTVMAGGGEEAVLAVARNGSSLAVGAVLAISTSVLRTARIHDLLRQPLWALADLLLAGAHALLLSLVIWLYALAGGSERSFSATLLPLLGVAWCLTPIYLVELLPEGILERMSLIGLATVLQLWALAGVATVLAETTGGTVTCLLLGVLMLELVLVVLGRGLHRPVNRLVFGPSDVPGLGLCCSGVFLPLFLGFSLLVYGFSPSELTAGSWLAEDWRWKGPVATDLLGVTGFLAAAALSMLILHLPRTGRKSRVDRLLAAGDVDAALDELSQHERSDYPKEWDPRLPEDDETHHTDPEAALAFLEACASNRVTPWAERLLFPSVHGLQTVDALDQPVFGTHTARILELLHNRVEARDNLGAENYVIMEMQRSGTGLLLEVLQERLAACAEQLGLTFEPPRRERGRTIAENTSVELIRDGDDEHPVLFAIVDRRLGEPRLRDATDPVEQCSEIPADEHWVFSLREDTTGFSLRARHGAATEFLQVDPESPVESPVTPGLVLDLPALQEQLRARMAQRFPGWPLGRPRP